jgi:hypothetical protein
MTRKASVSNKAFTPDPALSATPKDDMNKEKGKKERLTDNRSHVSPFHNRATHDKRAQGLIL